ncbi:MAG: hypothetical protein H6811_07215 [Phycisphaeraceae bacterium]|nr:hypothetical protein [Phycisphaeraceae bacterium]
MAARRGRSGPGSPSRGAPRGGLRPTHTDAQLLASWVAGRWVRMLEQDVPGDVLVRGREMARAGAVRELTISSGRARAKLQTRGAPPAFCEICVETFSRSAWDQIIGSLANRAAYAAHLLASELPPNIEDVFAPLGLRLFPLDASEVTVECSCDEDQWCPHVAASGILLADQLATEPFAMFALRGIDAEEFREGLRSRRALLGSTGAVPVHATALSRGWQGGPPTIDGGSGAFWRAGPELNQVAAPLEPPAVSHPLLRRLGPSPFVASRFPLVGLLATCYELISDSVLPEHEAGDQPANGPQPTDGSESAASLGSQSKSGDHGSG